MPVGGQVSLGLWEATPSLIPTLYFVGIYSGPGDVKCLRTSACLIMTISQMGKVRFVPHSKSPGQQATELWCARRPCSDTSSACIP